MSQWKMPIKALNSHHVLPIMTSMLAAAVTISAIGEPTGPRGLGFGNFGRQAAKTPEFFDSRDEVQVTVIPDRRVVAAGGDLSLAVVFDHQPGWHIHTHQPEVPVELGDAGDYIATSIDVSSSSDSIIPHPNWTQWPEAHEVEVAFGSKPVQYAVYEGRAVAFVPCTVAADAAPGEVTLTVRPVFQVCDDRHCLAPTPQPPLPGETPSSRWLEYGWTVDIEVVPLAQMDSMSSPPSDFANMDGTVFAKIRSGEEAPDEAPDVTFDVFGMGFSLDTDGSLGLILLLIVAGIGGFLLNLTPCVLPVIPLKIMAIAGSSSSRGRTMMLGIAMTLGVIGFWIGIGLAIALLTGFTASNQLFQYPIFTIGIGVIIAAMAVGMCGLFSVKLPSAVYMVSPRHDTVSGSFLFGIMTAVLATPCTAPFMGAAMAWAATEPPAITTLTFAAIGIGMSLPYLLLAAFPKLTDRMPKAGPASELIKQVMGLLMLAAATYFIGVGLSGMLADPPQPPSRMYFWFVAGVIAAAGFWLAFRTWQLTRSSTDSTSTRAALTWRWSMSGVGAIIVAAGIGLAVTLTDHGPIAWTWYTPEKFQQAISEGKVVVMEFTAEWCLNCKALEETVLATDEVASLLASPDVEPIKIDLTGNNTEGNAMLKAVDRHQIPLLVIFDPQGNEVFKGDFYTVTQVVEAVNAARSNPAS